MKIAVDAREMEANPTGVGRYLGNLLRSWLGEESQERFILFHRDDIDTDFAGNPRVEIRRCARGLFSNRLYWQQVVLLRALKRELPDLFFAPSYTMPLRWRGKTALTVHDVSFEAHPEWFNPGHGRRLRWLTRHSIRRAAKVITVSNFIKRELVERYGLPDEKVAVVYHGFDGALLRREYTPAEELRRKSGLKGSFGLMVGTIFERRFPREVISAFRHLKDLDIGLVIVGDDRRLHRSDLDAEIREMGLEGKVVWMRYCPESDLLGFYRSADFLIYLSAYEGFGLPPLEGMGFGLPAIVSRRGALAEVYGDYALTIADENEFTIAEAIRRIAEDESLRQELITRGGRLVEKLTLQSCAGKTLEIIRGISNEQ